MDQTLVDFLYRYWFRAEVEGIENVPASGGALLVSNHAGALPPGRDDDRQGHPRGAPAPAAAEHHGRALLQGLPGLLDAAAEGRRGGRPPRQRAPAAVRRGAAGAGLPRGPQGHREALQGPLPPAPLRPRRLRAGGHEGARADRARVRGGRRGGGAGVRPVQPAAEAHRPALRAAHAHVPAPGAAGHARLPPGQVQAALPGADLLRRAGPGGRQLARSRPWPTRSAPGSRRTCSTCSPSASRCGSGERLEADPDHRPVHLLGRPAGPGAGVRPLGRGDRGRGQRGAQRRAGAHRVREGRRPARAAAARGRGRRDRHGRGHAAGGGLGGHLARAWPTRTT